MSELINNREQRNITISEHRKEKLKTIMLDLYHGKSIDDVKAYFNKEIGTVTVDEIAYLSQMQEEFVQFHGLSRDEFERLASLHLSVMEGKIVENQHPHEEPGHPVHTFCLENQAIEKLLQTKFIPHLQMFSAEDSEQVRLTLMEDCNLLLDIDKHYTRKEQLLFPYLEKYGITGPSKNMWRMDDIIRDMIKGIKQQLLQYTVDKTLLMQNIDYTIDQVRAMIYREEHILFPMALNHLTEDEWIKIAQESDVIGYCLIDDVAVWNPHRNLLDESSISEGYIKFETGVLSIKQLELILNHLPIDVTFIDHNDIVRYFSHGKERIFHRTKAVIGRTVQNCHPPKSAHIVEEILDNFKSGKKDEESFWIKFRDKYVYIRYFAVRDEDRKYIGTLEFTQNIDPIQKIEGEKRILS